MEPCSSLSTFGKRGAGNDVAGNDDSVKTRPATSSAGPAATSQLDRRVPCSPFPTCRFFDFILLLTYSALMRNSAEGPSGDAPAADAPAPAPAPALTPPVTAAEKRAHLRFDKVFPVRVESILFGDCPCVARNVSAGGIFLESSDPLPLGARVRICFLTPDESAEIVAVGEVKNHYFLNYAQNGLSRAISGMAVRFVSFEQESQQVLRECLDRFRVLH